MIAISGSWFRILGWWGRDGCAALSLFISFPVHTW
jgi:hypothetical protein